MKKRLLQITLVLLLLVAGLAGGVVLDRQVLSTFVPLSTMPAGAEEGFALMAEAWNTIEESYVDRSAVETQRLSYGAISGMVDALGDTGHSRFLTPEMVQAQRQYNEGAFEGIGAYVEMKDGYTVIVAPMDGSPAQKANIQPGDIIVAVDGEDVADLPLHEVVQRILGPAGTEVTLTLLDPETGEARDVTVARGRIELDNVTWQQLPGTTIAHVRISAFSQGISDDLQQALAEITAQGMTGIVLDLRNNPGGLLHEAVGIASQFLPEGSVVLQRQDADGNVKAETVRPHGPVTDLPVVVLINQGSASASEIVAGALQDNGRATLIGETTFGTGTVLNQIPLSDGSVLMLATEQWLTPDGRVIWHQGIEPDETVAMDVNVAPLAPQAEAEMTADALRESGDTQLLQALELLAPQNAVQTAQPEAN